MTFDPIKFDGTRRNQLIQFQPQILIEHAPSVPAVAFPLGKPAVREGVLHVAAVGEKFDVRAGRNFFQSTNRRREFHAIVCRMLLAAENFFASILFVDDNRRPTARAGISQTRTVRINFYHLKTSVVNFDLTTRHECDKFFLSKKANLWQAVDVGTVDSFLVNTLTDFGAAGAAYFFPLKWSMTARMKLPTEQMSPIQSRISMHVTSFLRGRKPTHQTACRNEYSIRS